MASIASGDVETSLGRPLTDAELGQVNQWIDDAELLIRIRLGDLSKLNQDALGFVVREAVLERLKNVDGLDEETESIDDYTHGWKRSGTKRVTIWPEWWLLLSPNGGRRAFSVMPS